MFEIRISERRGRGHPKAGPEDAAKAEIRLHLLLGFCALATDKWPLEQFWRHLAIALSFNEGMCLDQTFPFEAKLVRTDGQSGRRCDPELQVRDQVFYAAVREKMAAGSKYEFAIDDALVDLEAQRKAEGWTKEFKRKIIKDAYDRMARKSRRD